MVDNTSRAVVLYLIKPPLISMRCFIRYNVAARDLYEYRLSTQSLTQQMVDEYLMLFQNYTPSKLLLHKIQICSVHKFNQPKVK